MVENFTTEPWNGTHYTINHLSMGISTTPDSLFCVCPRDMLWFFSVLRMTFLQMH